MVSGQGSSSGGQASTGLTTSLSFVPALLANAFFGSGIGLNKGGFQSTGLRDFSPSGKPRSGSSSLIDPFGLSAALRPTSPFVNIEGGGQASGPFAGIQQGLADLLGIGPASQPFQTGRLLAGTAGTETGGAQAETGGILNPFDLVSNLTDLVNPGVNPGLSGALQGIQSGTLGGLAGNNLLFGEGGISDVFGEGLQTGFKPDLQPVIDEASRAFFEDIVPQLGQSNVALQQGVGPFSTDLSGQLVGAGQTLASQLGALEVENQNRAADRRGELLGLSPLLTDTIFNAGTDAGRNLLDLGEQFALQGTVGGRQATLLQLLAGQVPAGPIQGSSSSNRSKSGGGGFFA